MNPSEYCAKWIPVFYGVTPGDPDYLAACQIELLSILPVSPSTIAAWGQDLANYTSRSWVDVILQQKDLLNAICKALKP